MAAYYNEIDPYAAQWLRNLITAGLIAPGDVDERSIQDVSADDLRGYEQCHFFAGIGGWSYALRLAGWPDDRPVWTGSCPCQPFSAAGAGKAADDERHLWPAWFPLIRELRPSTVFGEQVEAAVGWGWLDAVHADLEGQGYACGEAVLPACGVGAFHIRQRLWFVAHSQGERPSHGRGRPIFSEPTEGSRNSGGMADAVPAGWPEGRTSAGNGSAARSGEPSALDNAADARHDDAGQHGGGSPLLAARSIEPGASSELGNTDEPGSQGRIEHRNGTDERAVGAPSMAGSMVNSAGEQMGISRRTRQPRSAHFWSDAEWINCTDGKARPTKPGIFPLAHGVSARMGKLRAAGNAIVPALAAEFIAAASESLNAR